MNYEPAFPMASMDITKGMSLLDWFAGQAMCGVCGTVRVSDGARGEFRITIDPEERSKVAYAMAKAMLAERERIMKDSA